MADDDPERRHSASDIVAYRLAEIERRLDAQVKEQARGFADVRQQIAGLTFVRADVYAANQETAVQIHAELAKDIADGDAALASRVGDISTQVKLLWSVVGATVIAGLVGVLFQIANRA